MQTIKSFSLLFLTKPATKGNAKGPLSDLHLNNNVIIHCVPNVKLMVIAIDMDLNFSHHIALLSNKVGRQMNALSRL